MRRNGNLWNGEALALTLAAVAGFVDAVGYLTLHGLFTAHVTGNAAKLGIAAAHADRPSVAAFAAAPVFFVAGIAAGTALVDRGRNALPLGLQAVLVAFYMAYGSTVMRHGTVPDHRVAAFYPLEAAAIVALGLQTAAFTSVAGETTRTTYLSGMLTRFAQGVVRGAPARRLALLAALWCVYVGGATAGAASLGWTSIWCLAAPVAVLLVATAAVGFGVVSSGKRS